MCVSGCACAPSPPVWRRPRQAAAALAPHTPVAVYLLSFFRPFGAFISSSSSPSSPSSSALCCSWCLGSRTSFFKNPRYGELALDAPFDPHPELAAAALFLAPPLALCASLVGRSPDLAAKLPGGGGGGGEAASPLSMADVKKCACFYSAPLAQVPACLFLVKSRHAAVGGAGQKQSLGLSNFCRSSCPGAAPRVCCCYFPSSRHWSQVRGVGHDGLRADGARLLGGGLPRGLVRALQHPGPLARLWGQRRPRRGR